MRDLRSHGPSAYDMPSSGYRAAQGDHNVYITENRGARAVYHFLVDGDVSPVETDPQDPIVDLGRYTLVDGTVHGGFDEYTFHGGIVEAWFESHAQVELDGSPVTAAEAVSSTGGTHPAEVDHPQCVSDGECAGDLVCENNQCVIPDGLPQCETNSGCNGDLVCDGGMCVRPSGGGGGGGGGGGNGGGGGGDLSDLLLVAGVAGLGFIGTASVMRYRKNR